MMDTDTTVIQERIGELCHQFKLPTMGAQSMARFTEAGHGDALSTFLEVLEQEAEDRRHRRINRLVQSLPLRKQGIRSPPNATSPCPGNCASWTTSTSRSWTAWATYPRASPVLDTGGNEKVRGPLTLIAERYERRSLGITSNLVFSEWERIFANPMATVSAIDRVVRHAIILEFDVPSYRTDSAQQGDQSEGGEPAKPIDGNSADLVDARHWPCTIDQSSTVSIR